MSKLVLLLVLAVASVAWASTIVGGKTDLTQDEVSSADLKQHEQPGLVKIKEGKEAANSIVHCVDYDVELVRGKKQVVSGFSYDLILKLTPKKSGAEGCANEAVSLPSAEECEVNVWVKAGLNAGTEYTYKHCTEVSS